MRVRIKRTIITGSGRYFRGELMDFEDEVAARLITSGAAESVQAEMETAALETPRKKKRGRPPKRRDGEPEPGSGAADGG